LIADAPRGFVTIEPRHTDVHEHDIRLKSGRLFDGFESVARDTHVVAHEPQEHSHALGGIDIVVRNQEWSRDTLLVAVTGWGPSDDAEEATAAGFDHHFTKPLDPAELRRLVSSARPH
jgi:CheY-like chemotaxis protein